MFKWRDIAYALVIILLFFILIIVATITYSGDQDQMRENRSYINRQVHAVLSFSANLLPKWPSSNYERYQENYLEKGSWWEKVKGYFLIGRDKEGLKIMFEKPRLKLNQVFERIFNKKQDK